MGEVRALLLIADIGGYTKYMRLHLVVRTMPSVVGLKHDRA